MKTLYIHPDNPQARLIDEAVSIIKNDGVMIFPTELGYAFGLSLSSKANLDYLGSLTDGVATLFCRDLSQVSEYASMDNEQFRTLKAHTPSPISFVLPATKATPKKWCSRQKTVNVQIQHSPMILALLEKLSEPLLVYFLSEVSAMSEPYEIEDTLDKQTDVFLTIGTLPWQLTTVVDMTTASPVVVQQGVVDISDWT